MNDTVWADGVWAALVWADGVWAARHEVVAETADPRHRWAASGSRTTAQAANSRASFTAAPSKVKA